MSTSNVKEELSAQFNVADDNSRQVHRPFARCWLIRALAVMIFIVGCAETPAAWAYLCSGTIDSVNLDPSGIVTVGSASSGLGTFYVCELGNAANGVSADACSAILASLIAAKEANEQVGWQFNDALTCTTHPQWAWLTGWYYGPSLQ